MTTSETVKGSRPPQRCLPCSPRACGVCCVPMPERFTTACKNSGSKSGQFTIPDSAPKSVITLGKHAKRPWAVGRKCVRTHVGQPQPSVPTCQGDTHGQVRAEEEHQGTGVRPARFPGADSVAGAFPLWRWTPPTVDKMYRNRSTFGPVSRKICHNIAKALPRVLT